ncbi:MAG: cytochrome c-type biogenesis CcmF C-terminal domain-containing protein [Sutterella wadsworthensis]
MSRATPSPFNGVELRSAAPNFTADRGDFTLSVNGKELQHLYPEKRKYYSSNSMPMTESAIRHSITGDVYVSLGAPSPMTAAGWCARYYEALRDLDLVGAASSWPPLAFGPRPTDATAAASRRTKLDGE